MAAISRRALLVGGAATTLAAVVGACSSDGDGDGDGQARPRPRSSGTPAPDPGSAAATTLPLTPACDDTGATPEQTEGPFFTRNSPEKASFLGDVDRGAPIVVTGSVLTTACRPVAGALLDVWHADDAGDYDTEGYRLRGHLFADAQGRYRFETIVPGLYPGRTRHFHVKVQAEGGPVLTTQLYFPDERGNANDTIFQPELLMDVRDGGDAMEAAFDFVIET
jgi:protocatechuate 3,4-dioxygenase beta subunit